MPPLWQYFSRLQKADEFIPAPKGRGSRTPSPFSCKPSVFRGPREGP
jgi:hypothetical protein